MSTDPIFLPELREMLAQNDEQEIREFCNAFHPVRTAEFLDGLKPAEIWRVLEHIDRKVAAEIFSYFDEELQVEIVEVAPREEIADFIEYLPSDDRVDVLQSTDKDVVAELFPLMEEEDRRDIQRLSAFAEDTCGSEMSTDFVRLRENMTVGEALQEISRQTEAIETVYYLYVVDKDDHLVGLVSAKQLLVSMGRPQTPITSLMKRDLITVLADDDREEAAKKVSRYDFLAIPVVDTQRHMLGIITYDDVIDLNEDEMTKQVHQMGAVQPMDTAYLETPFFTIWHKRVFWLACLFIAELFTFSAMAHFEEEMAQLLILVMFVPLCISIGGNSGSQAATLITRCIALGEVTFRDWGRVMRHELLMGLALGLSIGAIGFIRIILTPESYLGSVDRWILALTIAQAVTAICLCGTLVGSLLPLLFKRIGVDPAVASSPFVATFVDVSGIFIYFSIAKFWLLSGAVVLPAMVALPGVSIEFSLREPTQENKEIVQQLCYEEFSQLHGLHGFYATGPSPIMSDSSISDDYTEVILKSPKLNMESLATQGVSSHAKRSAQPATVYQVGCVLIFKNQNSCDKFISSGLSPFLSSHDEIWQDKRVTLFEAKTDPEKLREKETASVE